MSAPSYGTPGWLGQLPSELRPIGRIGQVVIVRYRDHFYRVVGGEASSPTLMQLKPDELDLIVPYPLVSQKQRIERAARILIGDLAAAPSYQQILDATWGDKTWAYADWREWYNKGASAAEQEKFDRIAKVLDAGGADYMQGGKEQTYIEQWKYTDPTVYRALVSYRDTGGRRALFSAITPNYGPEPISTIKAGGPLEKNAAGDLILHPGRYTYSAIAANDPAFRLWLDEATKARKATLLLTQATEEPSYLAMLYGMHSDALFIDYEFLVAADLKWDTRLPGHPTWLPHGVHVEQYWGKPTPHAKPNLDALKEAAAAAAAAAASAFQGLATLAVLGGLVYVVVLAAGSSRARATA